jgi:hypothetical protein
MLATTLPIEMASSIACSALIPARKLLATGRGAATLSSHVIAQTAVHRPIRLICGDNRFDPYLIARLAKAKGFRPQDALSSVLIARAFTAYQFVELVNRLEPRPRDIVLISGPCTTFFDEDISHTEAARLFYRAFWRLVDLAKSGVTLLMLQSETSASQRREYFLKDLRNASDIILNFNDRHTFMLEHKSRGWLPKIPATDCLLRD